MSTIFFLILRRMRLPLVLIVVVYTITTIGLALVPGIDADGRPTPGMGIFTAFYVISYTGSTIGFGEIPSPYSPGQRLWMTVSIYATVIGWSYAIVSMLSLLGESGFRQALSSARFARQVHRLREGFYLVCGYGETGSLVCQGLDRLHLRFVVVERDEQRLEELQLAEFASDPPSTTGDASQPGVLTTAGLLSSYCRGVMALAVDDETNQAIAVACRLLRPEIPVLARIRDPDFDTHLGVFGGAVVINPFERFADHLTSALLTPEHFHLREILTGFPGRPLPQRHYPPQGHWIMCGYGRFGHAVVERLRDAGQSVSVIDVAHYGDGEGAVDVKGRGTEAGTLQAAGIDRAVGIVVGNKEDLRNLAIAVHARDLRPGIFVVTRINQASNVQLFDLFEDDLPMEPYRLVAQEFLAVITTPLLGRFLELLQAWNEGECATLIAQLCRVHPGSIPEVWSIRLDAETAPAVTRALASGQAVTLEDLMRRSNYSNARIRAVPLLHARPGAELERPGPELRLAEGDELLFAGHPAARHNQVATLVNDNVLHYARTGKDGGSGWLWQKLFGAPDQGAA